MAQTGLGELMADLTRGNLERLALRARGAPLFAHAYAFHLNMRLGSMKPSDLLDWAALHRLSGVKIHAEDGEDRSLLRAPHSRAAFGVKARDLGLQVHIETSSTLATDLADAIAVAKDTGATQVRCYPRHVGPLSSVLSATTTDLRALAQLDPTGSLDFTLEQHEDLTSAELVGLIHAVGNPRLSLLFDFANMVNAGEMPLTALQVMAPHVTDVHIKDAHILPDRGGMAHRACATGQGDIPIASLMIRLLLLGDQSPQIRAFALEEEADYFAPAFHFPNDGPDPQIPARAPSQTDPGTGPLDTRLTRERQQAKAQLDHVRNLLVQIKDAALIRLQEL